MGKVIYTNALGDSIELSNRQSEYVLNLIDGIGDVGVDIQVQESANSDGGIITSKKIQTRDITLAFTIFGADPGDLSDKRLYAAQVFNPSLEENGTLVYEIDESTSYSIECTPRNIIGFPSGKGNRAPTFQRAELTLLAPNPFWTDDIERVTELFAFTEGFSFPFEFPVMFGEQGVSETIYNTGHQAAPVMIELTGPNTTPRVTNLTTGQFMEFNRTLAPTEKLVINTKKGSKFARIVRANGTEINAMPYLAAGSSFFSLQLGENKLSYNASAGTGVSVARITWSQLYNAI